MTTDYVQRNYVLQRDIVLSGSCSNIDTHESTMVELVTVVGGLVWLRGVRTNGKENALCSANPNHSASTATVGANQREEK